MNNYYPYGYNPFNNNQDNQLTFCDSIDFVKSQNVRMDGQPMYYPLTNGKEIYCKKLNPNTGTSMISVYKLSDTESGNDEYKKIIDEISEIKTMVLEALTSPSKGGK